MKRKVLATDDELTMRTQLEFSIYFKQFIQLEKENHEEKSISNRRRINHENFA